MYFISIFHLLFFYSTLAYFPSNYYPKKRSLLSMSHHDVDPTILYKNKQYIRNIPYSTLLKNIKNNEISKIYISNDNDVIAENKEDSEEIMNDYTLTNIIPEIKKDIIDLSIKNNVDTVFKVKEQPVNPIKTVAYEVFGFFNNIIIPIISISIILSLSRTLFSSFFGTNNNQNMFNGNTQNNFPGYLNIDLAKDKNNILKSNITLQSFAGSPEIFEECMEVVSYLKNATIYKEAGAEIPKGILFEGPPGTGKTLLAKAIASETESNFISIAASEFVEVFVGVGASKVRNLFSTARKNKPCIIFIDEFDSVGRQRGTGMNMANDEREQTLNQLLAEMDGFENNEGILVIAATNRKDVLDSALLRPGRFDRIINVALPDKTSRTNILKQHSKNKKLAPSINLDLLSELTQGFSGAQLKNLLNEAAIFAARRGEAIIQNNDLLDALEKLTIGLIRKNDTRSEESKKRVAIHEIGHAFLCHVFNNYFDLKKVTIQSTYNGAGGYTLFNEYFNISESGLYTKDMFKKQLIIAMGGKAAETIYYGNEFVSVGAIQDLKQANNLAHRMISNFGMGKELEPFYNKNTEVVGFGKENMYSEKTKEMIDKESLELVEEALIMAKNILAENKEMLDKLVNSLVENTTILGDEFDKLINNYKECQDVSCDLS